MTAALTSPASAWEFANALADASDYCGAFLAGATAYLSNRV